MVRSGSVYRLAAGFLLVLACGSLSAGSPSSAAGWLRVDSSGRFFVDGGGSPFFFLGDTATRMNHMLNREDMDLYFSTRASQGFTAVLASAFRGHLPEYPKPNVYGEWPFVNDDITQPNTHSGYDYWDHIDYMVDTAGAYGLTVALVAFAIGWDDGGYRYVNSSNAYAYGRWIGARYGDRSNVVWVLGWDNPVDSSDEATIWNEMARGIEDGAGGSPLISFHPSWRSGTAGSSSQWFHTASWLDFNMVQSTLGSVHPALTADYNLWPAKPSGIGEGPYENGQEFSTLEMRKQAWWSYLAGGYHVSGNLTIWGFGDTGDWKSALHTTAAWQMRHVRNLFESRAWWTYVPDQSVFASGDGWGTTLNAASRSANGDGIIAYLSSPTTVSIQMGWITQGSEVDASWYDPTSGGTSTIGRFSNSGTQSFSTPGGWEDAVLLLDGVNAPPGNYSLWASPSQATPGQSITVTWTTPSGQGSSTDWIGLYAVGADNFSYLDWRYASGADSGSVTMPAPGDGTYEFRYLLNDGYQSAATSNSIVVSSGGGGDVYLSDLSWAFESNGWGPVERDMSNGEAGAGDGTTITLNGAAYSKGLGVHAYSEVRVDLGGSYTRFVSDIGLDDEMDVWQCGSVVFQVWADGELLYDSGVMTVDSPTQTVDVDVAGRQELVLVVTDAGDGFDCDHASWAGARLATAAVAAFVQTASAGTSSSSGGGCGATGMEVPLILAILGIVRTVRSGRPRVR